MDISTILMIISAMAQAVEELAPVVPVIEKLLKGEVTTSQDAAVVEAALQALEKLVEKNEAAAEAPKAPVTQTPLSA